MEVILAAILPLGLAVVVVRLASQDREVRRATVLFAFLTALWFSPAWLTMSSPVSLDFLLDSPPLDASKPKDYLQKNFLLNDIPLQILPWREASVRSWRNLSLPFLDRHAASGTPLWENLQVAVLYPPNLLSIPLSTFAWPLFMASTKVMVALIGMYLLLRELSRGHLAAIFGSIAFGFGVFTIVWVMFALASVTTLLPLLMFFYVRRAKGNQTAIVWATVTLIVMFTGGQPEGLFHCAFIALPWCIAMVVRRRESWRPLARDYFLSGVVALLVAAPLVVPFLAYVPHSQRLGEIARHEGFLTTPQLGFDSFVTFLIPNYFGNPFVQNYRHAFNYNELSSQFVGLTTLVFALGAVISRWRRYVGGVSLFVAIFLLSTQPEWLHNALVEIPLFGITSHSRLRFALGFLLAIAGAEGFERLTNGNDRRYFSGTAAVVFVTVSAIALFSYPVFAEYGIRRLIFFSELAGLMGCALVALIWFRPRVVVGPALCVLLFVDLFTVVGPFNPANGRELYYPAVPSIQSMTTTGDPYRIAALERAIQQNQSVFYGLEDIRPHDPLAYQPYVDVLDQAGLDRSTYFEVFKVPPPKSLLDFLGTRFVMTPPEANVPLPIAYSDAAAVVYRNDDALPRYFVPTRVTSAPDPAAAMLKSSNAREVFAARSVLPAGATLTLTRYDTSSTSIAVEASGETFIATSEVALPGWRLLRDETNWPMETINGAFIGWQAPKGVSNFVLRYEPLFLRESVAVSAIALLVLAFWFRRLRKEEPVGT